MCGTLQFEYYSKVIQSSVEWLWYPYIPYGKLTVLQGDPGEGKSTFILNIAALLSTGKPMPDGFPVICPQNVLYQCAEDNVSDTIKPRLLSAGADCDRIAYIIDEDLSLTLDDKRIEQVIEETSARLLVLDPLQAFLSQDGDMQSASRMRTKLGELAAIAARQNCAIVLVGHMNKTSSGKKMYRGLGSIDIAAIARSVLMIAKDEADESIRYMYQIKSSLAPTGDTIGFKFDKETGFHWLGRCEDVFTKERDDGQGETKKAFASRYIFEMLRNGETPATEIMDMLNRLGISARTIKTAKKDLDVRSYRKEEIWYWKLPSFDGADDMG